MLNFSPKKTISYVEVLFKYSLAYTFGDEKYAVSEVNIRLSDALILNASVPLLLMNISVSVYVSIVFV